MASFLCLDLSPNANSSTGYPVEIEMSNQALCKQFGIFSEQFRTYYELS